MAVLTAINIVKHLVSPFNSTIQISFSFLKKYILSTEMHLLAYDHFFRWACAAMAVFLLPVINLIPLPSSFSASSISSSNNKIEILEILQHHGQCLAVCLPCMRRNGYLRASGGNSVSLISVFITPKKWCLVIWAITHQNRSSGLTSGSVSVNKM